MLLFSVKQSYSLLAHEALAYINHHCGQVGLALNVSIQAHPAETYTIAASFASLQCIESF